MLTATRVSIAMIGSGRIITLMIVTAANARTMSLYPVRARGALPAGAAKIESISARTPRHHSCTHAPRRHRRPGRAATSQQQDNGRDRMASRRTSGAHGGGTGLAAMPLASCVARKSVGSGKRVAGRLDLGGGPDHK